EVEPRTHGGVGEDRRSGHPALRELRADPERAVDEQCRRLQAVELGIEIVTPDQQRQPVGEQVLLQPGLLEPHHSRRLEVTDTLQPTHVSAITAASSNRALSVISYLSKTPASSHFRSSSKLWMIGCSRAAGAEPGSRTHQPVCIPAAFAASSSAGMSDRKSTS